MHKNNFIKYLNIVIILLLILILSSCKHKKSISYMESDYFYTYIKIHGSYERLLVRKYNDPDILLKELKDKQNELNYNVEVLDLIKYRGQRLIMKYESDIKLTRSKIGNLEEQKRYDLYSTLDDLDDSLETLKEKQDSLKKFYEKNKETNVYDFQQKLQNHIDNFDIIDYTDSTLTEGSIMLAKTDNYIFHLNNNLQFVISSNNYINTTLSLINKRVEDKI